MVYHGFTNKEQRKVGSARIPAPNRDDVDHILGGKGDTYWYVIMKKCKVTGSYIGKNSGGIWEDVCIKGSGAGKKTKAMPTGSTIKRIAEKAYLCQNETWVTGRTASGGSRLCADRSGTETEPPT